jgi:hypothetical protein
MSEIQRIIEQVMAGVPAREAVAVAPPQMMGMDFPHGWKESEASGSRLKVLYNPMPKYKRHIVRLDTKTGAWTHQGPGGHDAKGAGDLLGYLNQLHPQIVHEAVDKDSAAALSPRGPKRMAAEPEAPKPGRAKKEPVDPTLKKRAMDWHKYQTQNAGEEPGETAEKIRTTLANHGWVHQPQWPVPAGVQSFQHPEHPTHVIHLLSGPDRPQGSPDPSWYHHDTAMVAHNSGYDSDSLDLHLGDFHSRHQQ